MGKIDLEMLHNTRDLGGLKTIDGRVIKENMLIRSGALYGLSENDVSTLRQHGLSMIIDFRTKEERAEKPDPIISDVENAHLNILDFKQFDKSNELMTGNMTDLILQQINEKGLTVEKGKDFIRMLYYNMFTNPFCLVQYSKFVDYVLSNDKGSTLWHCTNGKDRAGMGTVIILEALGVDRKDIIDDYLLTGEYTKKDIESMKYYVSHEYNNETLTEIMLAYLSVEKSYIQSAYKGAVEKFGSVDNFLKDALGIDDEKRTKLKNKFLI